MDRLTVETSLTLVRPDASHREMYLAMVADYEAAGEARYQPLVEVLNTDFEGYVRHLKNWALGLNLKPGWVPCTVYWSVADGLPYIVGELHIRHWLTPSLEREGGHIGYTIAPSMRRKGLGTLQMALGLEKAREILETDRVLVTCDTDNVGSARVIENNGGVFEDHAVSERSGKQINRYWITLSPSRKPYGSSETLGVC